MEKPAAHTSGDTMQFPADAPQLTFLQIKPVEAFPEPLVDSLNARIAYDDNHTARVFSPHCRSGHRRSLPMRASKSRRAIALLCIDSPDLCQSASRQPEGRGRPAAQASRPMSVPGSYWPVKGIARKDVESAEADLRQAEAEAQRAKARLKNLHSMTTDDGRQVHPACADRRHRQRTPGESGQRSPSGCRQSAVRHYRTASICGC